MLLWAKITLMLVSFCWDGFRLDFVIPCSFSYLTEVLDSSAKLVACCRLCRYIGSTETQNRNA